MKNPQGKRWRRLDNTGKLFPLIANENLSNVFRISAVLKEDIRPELLQQALEDIIPFFEGFRVALHKGFFWYYFEYNKKLPQVENESTYPCKYIDPHSHHQFLFRVSYYGTRINLEIFHALSDGLGAVNFLRELTYRYLQLVKIWKIEEDRIQEESWIQEAEEIQNHPIVGKCGKSGEAEKKNSQTEQTNKSERINSSKRINSSGRISSSEPYVLDKEGLSDVEDSYLKNYKKVKKQKYNWEPAYHVPGTPLLLDQENVQHGILKLSEIKKVTKAKGVSMTKYLTAALIWAIYQEYLAGRPMERKIGISLPVNLRAFFGSTTTSNFFAVTDVGFQTQLEQATFDEILQEVSLQMDAKITKENMEEKIAYNVSNEKKWYIRIIPLFIKWISLNVIFARNDITHTMTLSNLGPVKVEEQYQDDIRQFYTIIGVSKRQPLKCAVMAYGEDVTVSFTSIMSDNRMQDRFFGFLESEGISVRKESNGVVPDSGNVTYPKLDYDPDKWKRMVNCLYAVLAAVAVMLGIINYATYDGFVWSGIAIGGILYTIITLRYSILHHASLGRSVMTQALSVQALLLVIDIVTGFHRWSVNYAIPGTILFADVVVVFLIVINRMKWQSYFMYQLAITILSFVPLILWALGWVTEPFMSMVTVILTVLILSFTFMLGDRRVKRELIRRFHF